MKSVDREDYVELCGRVGGLYRVEVWEGGICVDRFRSCVLLGLRKVDFGRVSEWRYERGGLEMLIGGVKKLFWVYFDSYNRSIYDLRIMKEGGV
jgi:hypothetical protein